MKATLVLLAVISLHLHAAPAGSEWNSAGNGQTDQSFDTLPEELVEYTEDVATDQNSALSAAPAPIIKSSPVKVRINISTQQIEIIAPETKGYKNGIYPAKVSTGGGLKNPVDPTTGLPDTPYCADDVTPVVGPVVIPAIEGRTMFPNKRSNRFTTSEGQGVKMPNAIAVPGHPGIYLHAVPSGYEHLLGQNVSGGCIRLDPYLSKWLYDEMLAYGSIELTIIKPYPLPKKCGNAVTQPPPTQRYYKTLPRERNILQKIFDPFDLF